MRSPREVYRDTRITDDDTEYPDSKIYLNFFGGIIAGLIIILLGLLIINDLYFFGSEFVQTPTILGITLVLLGLTTGYNIGMSFYEQKMEFVFFSGFFITLWIIGIYNAFFNLILIALLILTTLLPLVLIFGGRTENETWSQIIKLASDYAPKTWIITIITGKYLSVPFGVNFELFGYIIGLILGIIITFISYKALDDENY